MNLEEAIIATDKAMLDTVASDVPILREASEHIISAGGKRIRPRILFLAYQAMGGTDLEEALPVAAAIELVHTATLVHDDINDHGKVRRGRTTVNEKWGRTFALLTGDYLFTRVYALMAPYGDLNVSFAEATVALVEGETLQAAAVKNNTLNRETYQQIVAKKTASLFRACAMLGAQLAGGEQLYVDALGEYGFFLGLAFQIVDDLLDIVGDSTLMGKEVGVDVGQGKGVTRAYHAGNGGAGDSTGVIVAELDAADGGDPFQAIKRKLIEGGAIEEGKRMAEALIAQANQALDRLPPGPAVDDLRDLAAFVLERQA
jgi:octaprenyl-diphosphate synthase